jgi:hypothetical protein
MKVNTNHWNQWRYALYAPVYDRVVSYFDKQRNGASNYSTFNRGIRF